MTLDLFSFNDPIGDDAGLSRAERDRYGDRTDVLDKVKAIPFLPDGLHLGTELVANYYEVGADVITKLAQRHREELEANGYRLLTGQELVDMKSSSGIASRAPQLAVFDRRALVRVGLLLRDSDVARRVRDAVQDGYEATALPDLSDPLAALAYASEQWSKSVALALAERRRAEVAESNVRALAPAANAWAVFLDAGRSMEVGAAAKCLASHGVDIGRNRLYTLLREWRWVFQRSREPMGSAVERGYVRLALDKPHTNPKTGEEEDGSARTRITGKGLERLASHFGVCLDPNIVNEYLDQQESAA